MSLICDKKNFITNKNSRLLTFLSLWKAGQPAALDITKISPSQPSLIGNAAAKIDFAVSAAEDRK